MWVLMTRLAFSEPPAMPLVPEHPDPVDHSGLFTEPFTTPQDVTAACLTCHPESGEEMLHTSHWTWLSDEARLPGSDTLVSIGKRNMINNFCISVASNWPRCTSCHPGYGWVNDSYDFSNPANIDCLVCHDRSGQYKKEPTAAGMPAEGVDLLAAAQSVGRPTRANCGACHFNGGGGNAIKHGDLDQSLIDPTPETDIHMGGYGMLCTDCHRTQQHQIQGRLLSLNNREDTSVHCTDCHADAPHKMGLLNDHTARVACQACHIPYMALEYETKLTWDWGMAGLDEPPVEEEHLYSKMKGLFTYGKHVMPEYFWFNGSMDFYLPSQQLDPDAVVNINNPLGSREDPTAKIWPFKVHRGRQIYDAKYNYLLVPKVFGEHGYWQDFDWNLAAELGSAASGIPYSGEYGFTATAMFWPTTHMVQAKASSVGCRECHGGGRLDWAALGYEEDPGPFTR